MLSCNSKVTFGNNNSFYIYNKAVNEEIKKAKKFYLLGEYKKYAETIDLLSDKYIAPFDCLWSFDSFGNCFAISCSFYYFIVD